MGFFQSNGRFVSVSVREEMTSNPLISCRERFEIVPYEKGDEGGLI
jgi:hypothetical protein